MDTTENNIAERLPLEILTHILLQLSSPDRKNARLVNSLWYEASKEIMILKKQKIILDNFIYKNQYHLIFDVLNNAKYRYYNLEFQNGNFHSDLMVFLNFIKSNTSYIFSLSFINCSFPFVMLGEIMIICSNLKELRFENCTCIGFKKTTLIPNLEQKLIQKNLTTLEIIKCRWMTNYIFNIFIGVYPNIKKINFSSMRIKYYNKPEENVEQNLHDGPLWFCNFYREGGFNLENLESLNLNEPEWNYKENEGDREQFNKLMSIPQLKLKELNMKGHYHEKINFKSLFSMQKNLRSVDLRTCDFDLDSLEFLYQQCPNLERLQYSTDFRGRQSSCIKRHLEFAAKSKLKYLNMEDVICLTEGITSSDYPSNYNTSQLGLHGRWVVHTLATTLLQIFCNLTDLDLTDALIKGSKQEVGEIIFQKQVKLKTLKLKRCEWITDEVFNNCQLANLEYLELGSCPITEASFSEFNFPKLTYLSVEWCKMVTDEGFAQIPNKCPSLRSLNLNRTAIKLPTVLNICENLKFLHKLYIRYADIIYEVPISVNVKTISQHCPSLRYMELQFSYAYSYNYIEKEWICRDMNIVTTPTTP